MNAVSSTAEVSNDAVSSTAEVSNHAESSTAEVSNDAVSSLQSSNLNHPSASSPTPPVTSDSSSQINLDTQEQSYSTAESQPQQQNFASVDSSNIKDDVEQSENEMLLTI